MQHDQRRQAFFLKASQWSLSFNATLLFMLPIRVGSVAVVYQLSISRFRTSSNLAGGNAISTTYAQESVCFACLLASLAVVISVNEMLSRMKYVAVVCNAAGSNISRDLAPCA